MDTLIAIAKNGRKAPWKFYFTTSRVLPALQCKLKQFNQLDTRTLIHEQGHHRRLGVASASDSGPTPESDSGNVLVAHGFLTLNDAGTEWVLTPPKPLSFQGQEITSISFALTVHSPTSAYGLFQGQDTELEGEVDHVSRGIAVLRNVHTVGLSPVPFFYLSGDQPRHPPSPADLSSSRVSYKHAYYLFLASTPQGCEACYVPLLITQQSLEEIAEGKESKLCLMVYTYERDSLWQIKGATPVAPAMVETKPRMINLLGRSYRYQEAFPREIVKLLENPMGSIPISRPFVPNNEVPGAGLKELIQDFRRLVQ